MWDPSSLAGDRTPCIGRWSLNTTGPPGKSLLHLLNQVIGTHLSLCLCWHIQPFHQSCSSPATHTSPVSNRLPLRWAEVQSRLKATGAVPGWGAGSGHHRKIISFTQQHPKPKDHTHSTKQRLFNAQDHKAPALNLHLEESCGHKYNRSPHCSLEKGLESQSTRVCVQLWYQAFWAGAALR